MKPSPRATPRLPDDVLCLIHRFYAVEQARSTATPLLLRQHETGCSGVRRMGNASGWLCGEDVAIVAGTLSVGPVPDTRYNFTVVRHPRGVGILESNCGEGFGSVPPSFAPFLGILPWGTSGTKSFTHAGWSRGTRCVRIDVPVWFVPRAWGFDGPKAYFSKVIVTELGGDLPEEEAGIVDPASDPRGMVLLDAFPSEAREARCL